MQGLSRVDHYADRIAHNLKSSIFCQHALPVFFSVTCIPGLSKCHPHKKYYPYKKCHSHKKLYIYTIKPTAGALGEKELYNENELLMRLTRSDEEAFAGLYHFYYPQVYSFIIKYIPAATLADDLTQEVFIKIWEKRAHLAAVRSFRAYLFISARNHTLNALKKILRSRTAGDYMLSSYAEQRSSAEEQLIDKEYRRFLDKMLAKLPERSRQIFRLCREQGKTYEEVASALGISRNAVKNHMVYSLKVLSASAKRELGISICTLLSILNIA